MVKNRKVYKVETFSTEYKLLKVMYMSMDNLFDDVESGKDDGRFSLFKITPEFSGVNSFAVLPDFDLGGAIKKMQSIIHGSRRKPTTHTLSETFAGNGFIQIQFTEDGESNPSNVSIYALLADRNYMINYDQSDFTLYRTGALSVSDEQRSSDALKIREALVENGIDRVFNDKFQLI